MKKNFRPFSKGRPAKIFTALGPLPLLYFYPEDSCPAIKVPSCYPGFCLNVTFSGKSFLTTQSQVATQSLCFTISSYSNFLYNTYYCYIFLNICFIFCLFFPLTWIQASWKQYLVYLSQIVYSKPRIGLHGT